MTAAKAPDRHREGPEGAGAGLYGGGRPGGFRRHGDKMRDAYGAAKKPGDLIVYPDTAARLTPTIGPSYRKGQAEEGWQRLLSGSDYL